MNSAEFECLLDGEKDEGEAGIPTSPNFHILNQGRVSTKTNRLLPFVHQ